MTDDIQKFSELKQKLHDEFTTISAEIDDAIVRREELRKLLFEPPAAQPNITKLDTKFVALENKVEKKTVSVRKNTKVFADPNDENVLLLMRYLSTHPGANRADIGSLLEGELEPKEITALIKKCSNRGIIENKGSRQASAWHIVWPSE